MQAVIAICGFAIRGSTFIPKISLSAGFPSIIGGFLVQLASKMRLFGGNSVPLLSAVLVFAGLSKNVTPANNEGRL